MTPTPELDRVLPLTPTVFHVLVALAGGPRHGYAIIKEIETREGEASAPSTGALYLALQRLEREGMIDDAPTPEGERDRRRRYYRLTVEGRRVAEAESARLAGLLAAARTRKLLPGEGT